MVEVKVQRGIWHVKEKTAGGTVWKTRVASVYGPIVRQTTQWMNERMNDSGRGVFTRFV